MTIFNRHETIERLYDAYEGDIHYIMNNYDVDNDDFDFLMELKAFRNE